MPADATPFVFLRAQPAEGPALIQLFLTGWGRRWSGPYPKGRPQARQRPVGGDLSTAVGAGLRPLASLWSLRPRVSASQAWTPACSFMIDTAAALARLLMQPAPGLFHVDSNAEEGHNFAQNAQALKVTFNRNAWDILVHHDYAHDQRLLGGSTLVPPLSARLASLRRAPVAMPDGLINCEQPQALVRFAAVAVVGSNRHATGLGQLLVIPTPWDRGTNGRFRSAATNSVGQPY
jgi:hypothetical protein